MRIVSFTGKKGSGKDTAASIFNKHYFYTRRLSLAYPMKEVARYMFDWNRGHVEDYLKEQMDSYWGISPRQFLQEFGTFMREILPSRVPSFNKYNESEFWCRRLFGEMDDCLTTMPKEYQEKMIFAITDIRYKSEEQFFRRVSDDFALIRIVRPGVDGCIDTHSSENQFDHLTPDYIVCNDGSIDDLEKKIVEIMRNMGIIGDEDNKE